MTRLSTAHPTTAGRTGIALAALAAGLVALAGHTATATGAAEASERETGTVKTVVVATAGDKKVEVIKA